MRKELASRELSSGSTALKVQYCERQVQRILAINGLQFDALVRERRMARAAQLLLTGQYVKTVAPKVGYRPKHLAAPFGRYSGLTPRDVRRVGRLRSLLL